MLSIGPHSSYARYGAYSVEDALSSPGTPASYRDWQGPGGSAAPALGETPGALADARSVFSQFSVELQAMLVQMQASPGGPDRPAQAPAEDRAGTTFQSPPSRREAPAQVSGEGQAPDLVPVLDASQLVSDLMVSALAGSGQAMPSTGTSPPTAQEGVAAPQAAMAACLRQESALLPDEARPAVVSPAATAGRDRDPAWRPGRALRSALEAYGQGGKRWQGAKAA